jgi:hypothetical protein
MKKLQCFILTIITAILLTTSFAAPKRSQDFTMVKHLSKLQHKQHQVTLLFIQQAKTASIKKITKIALRYI